MKQAGILFQPVLLTAEQYTEAIHALACGRLQLEPDGQNCAVCGSDGHQAWECHHNPLAMMLEAMRLQGAFRCWHCGEVFTDPNAAEAHFGHDPLGEAACYIQAMEREGGTLTTADGVVVHHGMIVFRLGPGGDVRSGQVCIQVLNLATWQRPDVIIQVANSLRDQLIEGGWRIEEGRVLP